MPKEPGSRCTIQVDVKTHELIKTHSKKTGIKIWRIASDIITKYLKRNEPERASDFHRD